MKIFLARVFLKTNELEFNRDKIVSYYDEAVANGCDLLIFPEMAILGFPATPSLLDRSFIKRCDDCEEQIVNCTKDKKTRILFGCPCFVDGYVKNDVIKAAQLFNSVVLASDGYIDATTSKTTIGKENLFNESRYFDKDTTLKTIHYDSDNISVLIGDDINESKNIFFIKEKDTDYVVCLDSEVQDNMASKKKQLIKIAKWSGKNIIYMNRFCYDEATRIRCLGEVFIVNKVGEIVFSDCSIYEGLLQFKVGLSGNTLSIENLKTHADNENFIDIIARNNQQKTVVVEVNKTTYCPKEKNVILITFDKKLATDKVSFIDLKQIFKDNIKPKLDYSLKKIIICVLYKNSVFVGIF